MKLIFVIGPGAWFSKAPEPFQARKAKAKSRTFWLQSCFIHIFLICGEVHFIQEVSGLYTSPFLHTDEQTMALRARKGSGAFEKRAPGGRFSKAPETSRTQKEIFSSSVSKLGESLYARNFLYVGNLCSY